VRACPCLGNTWQPAFKALRKHPSDTGTAKWNVDEGWLLACANDLDWSCLVLRALPRVPRCSWIPKLGRRKQPQHCQI